MSIIFILIIISVIVAGGFLIVFFWAADEGQFDDMHTPPIRMLFDETTDEKPITQEITANNLTSTAVNKAL